MHHYILLVTKPEDHDKINQQLIGSLSSQRRVDPRTGIIPPSWWRGDAAASSSSIAAAVSLKRK